MLLSKRMLGLVLILLSLGTVAAKAVTHIVLVRDTFFSPTSITIEQGDVVRWQRMATLFHTTTSGQSSNPLHLPGALWDQTIDGTTTTFDYTFNDLGTFPYFCRFHEFAVPPMKGTVIVEEKSTPVKEGAFQRRFAFGQAFPNPFSSSISINLTIEPNKPLEVGIYSVTGKRIGVLFSGTTTDESYLFHWDGLDFSERRLPSGVYFLRAESEGEVITQRVSLVR